MNKPDRPAKSPGCIANSAALLMGFVVSIPVQAEQPISASIDCTQAEIYFTDQPDLTRAERLALMEKAFFDSVNRFELCQLATKEQKNTADSSGGGKAGGESSIANQDMQGTAAESAAESAYSAAEQAGIIDDNEVTDAPPPMTSGAGSRQNGAIPADIPSANNDDAIAAQIRRAAEIETDPEIQKKLWNEYRKYRGLDSVE